GSGPVESWVEEVLEHPPRPSCHPSVFLSQVAASLVAERKGQAPFIGGIPGQSVDASAGLEVETIAHVGAEHVRLSQDGGVLGGDDLEPLQGVEAFERRSPAHFREAASVFELQELDEELHVDQPSGSEFQME